MMRWKCAEKRISDTVKNFTAMMKKGLICVWKIKKDES